MSPPARTARLVLVTAEGAVVGALPPAPVATPWWQDIAPVVSTVHERWGVRVTILRLLSASLPAPPGGEVTYLAQVDQPTPAAAPWDGELDDHPLRLPYARPGGPAVDLAWAAARLADHGRRMNAPPVQIRTWNLSSLWRLPCEGGAAWLKVVPPFFSHEGALIAHLAGGPVPTLLAHDGARSLMSEIAGEDFYEARADQYALMVDLLVDLQARQAARIDALVAMGLPDRRSRKLPSMLGAVVERVAPQLDPADRATVASFLDGLQSRLANLATCGLPDTLVHDDFHPGNVRGQDSDLTVLDWGDSVIGHPILDQAAFLAHVPEDLAASLNDRWSDRWRRWRPGCDPARAARLIRPIAVALKAVTYQDFLDRIEPSEHPYHRADPADRLAKAAALIRLERVGDG